MMEIKCSLQGHKHKGEAKTIGCPLAQLEELTNYLSRVKTWQEKQFTARSPPVCPASLWQMLQVVINREPIHGSFCPSTIYTGKTIQCAKEIDPCETGCAVAIFLFHTQKRNHLLHLCKRSSEHYNRIRRSHFGFGFQK